MDAKNKALTHWTGVSLSYHFICNLGEHTQYQFAFIILSSPENGSVESLFLRILDRARLQLMCYL